MLHTAFECYLSVPVISGHPLVPDSYLTLEKLYRIPHNTISNVVPETCETIYTVLRNELLKVCRKSCEVKREGVGMAMKRMKASNKCRLI